MAVLVVGGLALAVVEVPHLPAGGAVAQDQAAGAEATGAATTTVLRVRPLDAHGHLRTRYAVTSTRRGYCWTTSFVNGRLYRCFQGNLIRDPCWKEAGRSSVVCPSRPWSLRVTRLRLTRHLPGTVGSGPRLWGLRVGGVGVSCVVTMGAGGLVGKHPISYVCQRGWVLLGADPDRSTPVWTMLSAKWMKDHYELRGRKPLLTAWKPVLR